MHEQYILVLCSTLKKPKLFLKRNVNDIHINGYTKYLVMVWQTNHDVQYVMDAYSCMMHICDYMTKAQKGMRTIMAEACKEVKDVNLTLKQNV